MENIIRNTIIFLMLIFSFALFTNAKDMALVVKQDGLKVYLDTSDFRAKPRTGDDFRIYEEGEEIVNPKTGKVLGKVLIRQATGRITQVEDNYAIGNLDQNMEATGLEAEIRVTTEPLEANTASKASTASFQEELIMPIWQSAPIEGRTKAATAADITGNGEGELILAFDEDNSINVFTVADAALNKLATAKVNPLRKIISLDAADLKGTGKAQIFATVLDTTAQKFNTLVLEYNDNRLEVTDTIKGMVKGIAPNGGKRVLYTQDVNQASNKFSYTTPALLIYEKNAFKTGEKLGAYNFTSIYGFNHGEISKAAKAPVIYVTSNGRVRIQFDKRSSNVDSPADMDFSTTPLRIKYNNGLKRLFVSLCLFKNTEGGSTIAAVEHIANLGILSDTFGSYNSAKLHFLKWDGITIRKGPSADIGGVVYDIIQAPFGKYQSSIIVPFTTGAGQTAVMLFEIK
jgi:hypothetical protein